MKGYLGPVGTYSYEAARKYFCDKTTELKYYPSITRLFEALKYNEADSIFVPVENSVEGSVTVTLDMLALYDGMYINGEYTMPICANLMANKGVGIGDIKKIMSHSQPIAQCRSFIEAHFPDAEIEFCESTAKACEQISVTGDKSTAVIGSRSASHIYKLDILFKGCNDEKNNSTRFIEIKKTQNTKITPCDKSSFIFTTENKPGCLYNAIKYFFENDVNMIKIESRPAKTEMGRYIFFIDTDGNIESENVSNAWECIKKTASKCKFAGSYKKG